MKRVEIGISGIVQGIGFRPFIYHLAQKHLIRGWVLNNEKGVFQNIFLLSLVVEGLRKSGFDVYTHHLVPTNDGGISLGQAVIAHMRSSEM